MSYLLVGEAPGRVVTKKGLEVVLALRTVSRRLGEKGNGLQLLQWLETHHPSLVCFMLATTHVNLLTTYPGIETYKGIDRMKGSSFPIAEGRAAAQRLRVMLESRDDPCTFNLTQFSRPRRVLLAGRRVAITFGLRNAKYFQKTHVGSSLVTVVPHPSGVNRWWNDDVHKVQAREFLEDLGRQRNGGGEGTRQGSQTSLAVSVARGAA